MEFNFFGPLGPQGAPGSKFAPDLFLGADVGKGFLCIGVEVENRPKTGPGGPWGPGPWGPWVPRVEIRPRFVFGG